MGNCCTSIECSKCGIPYKYYADNINYGRYNSIDKSCRYHRYSVEGNCIDCDGLGKCEHRWDARVCCFGYLV
jgi:hypothetical protein